MSKNLLLKGLPLLGGALLCAMPLNAAIVKTYEPISSVDELVDGQKYVIGVVGLHATNWGPKNPLVYTANADNTGYTFTAAPTLEFTEAMEWTVKVDESGTRVCSMTDAAHSANKKVVQLVRGEKAMKINASSTKGIAELTDAATYIEFVELTEAQSGLTGETVFQWHINYNSANTFQQIHASKPDGTLGWYTRHENNPNGRDWSILTGSDGSYSGMNRVYKVVETEDLNLIAAYRWARLKAEEKLVQPGYAAVIDALSMPEITDEYTEENIDEKLTDAFRNAVFAMDYLGVDYQATLSAPTANSLYTGAAGSTWYYDVTGIDNNYLKLTIRRPDKTTAANITRSTSNNVTKFDLRSGSSNGNNNANAPTVRINSFHPGYDVAAIQFTATATQAGQSIVIDGREISLPQNEAVTISGSNSFMVKGTNTQILIDDFKARMYANSVATGKPTASGWYELTLLRGYNGGTNFNAPAHTGKVIANNNAEYKQNNSNYYALKYIAEAPSDKPASTLVYFNVSGNNIQARSSNGHYIAANGTSQRAGANLTLTDKDNKTVQIGGDARTNPKWTVWAPNDNTATEKPYVGGSSDTIYNKTRYAIRKVDAAALYDLWTVTIAGDGATDTEIGKDIHITCSSANCKGSGLAYNGGTLFFAKGTIPTVNDFSVSINSNGSALISIDAQTKTITATMATKQEYVDSYIARNVTPSLLAPYKQSPFDQKLVAHRDTTLALDVAAAVTESAVITAADIENMDNVIATAIHEIALTPAGKLIQARNLLHGTLYLNEQTTDPNSLNGTTDKTALTTIWELEVADETVPTFNIKSYASGKYVGHTSGRETNISLVAAEQAHAYKLEPDVYTYQNAQHKTISFNDCTNGEYQYLHQTTSNRENTPNRTVKWTNTDASHWYVTTSDDEEMAQKLSVSLDRTNPTNYAITFNHKTGVSLRTGVTFADHHAMYLRRLATPAVEETPAKAASRAAEYDSAFETLRLEPTAIEADGDSLKLHLGQPIDEAGTYEFTMPAALIKVGTDKVSRQHVGTFKVNDDGSVTGIKVVAIEHEPVRFEGIYDLQGRRLSAPVRGINIINGRKTLVR